MLVTAGVVVAVLAVIVGLLWGFQRSLIYLPQGAPEGTPAGAEDVALHTDDGLELAAWWFDAGSHAPAVLVANGNGGHRGISASPPRPSIANRQQLQGDRHHVGRAALGPGSPADGYNRCLRSGP